MSKRTEGPRWGWIILTIWGLFALLPIVYFASIALRPRNEIIAPVPIYFPTITTETWAKIWAEWPIAQYFYNSVVAITGSVLICLSSVCPPPMRWPATSSRAMPTSAITSSPPR
jgi:multiple sugar transport system permease protein